MPNWCSTSYVVTGDEKEVRDLYETMKSLEDGEKSLVENGFGKTWLGNLVTILGGDWNKIYCRGEFSNLQIDSDYGAVRFDTMSGWAELRETRHFIQSKYPSLEFYYRSEEPGMCIYITNDEDGEYFPERILIEDYDGESEYCETWHEAFQCIAEKTGCEIHTRAEMNRVLETYNKEHECCEIYVYKFDVVES